MDELKYTEKEIRDALRAVLQKGLQKQILKSEDTSADTACIERIENELITTLRKQSVSGLAEGGDPEEFWGALCAALPDNQKRDIIRKLFPGYTDKEIAEAVKMLKCLYDNGMSLTQTSEILNIHKNTLNYRLNRLTRTTGLNPRSAEGAARYQMCVHIYGSISRF